MNPFAVLELIPGQCTEEDAKRNYRRLSFLYHPDKNPDNPSSVEKAQEINSAYEYLKKNPHLFNRNSPAKKHSLDVICTHLQASTKDLYLRKQKTVVIDRKIPCSVCSGTGSTKGKCGVCTLCSGTGKVGNKLLRYMRGETIQECPSCHGEGIQPNTKCTSCMGSRYQNEKCVVPVQLNIACLSTKSVLIQNAGNIKADGSTGDVYVSLDIDNTEGYHYTNGRLFRAIPITPVQSLIGDNIQIDIFGKKYTIKIPFDEIELLDKRPGIEPNRIVLHTVIKKPTITDETRELYQKILDIERNAIS